MYISSCNFKRNLIAPFMQREHLHVLSLAATFNFDLKVHMTRIFFIFDF